MAQTVLKSNLLNGIAGRSPPSPLPYAQSLEPCWSTGSC